MKALISFIIIIFTIFVLIFFSRPYLEKSNFIVVSVVNSSAHVPEDHIAHKNTPHIVSNNDNSNKNNNNNNNKISDLNVNKLISAASNQGLKPKALKSALNAYSWALNHGKLGSNKDTLTVVDFSLPSYEKRMWVLSLHQNKVLMSLYTTQGSGSGLVYASRFSNASRTQASSLGLYVTSDEYYGHHGISMRLDGLQKNLNSNARKRNIVIHEAAYASPAYIRANHRAGRSWGCFAVASSNKNILLRYIKGGSAFFAYAHSIEKNPMISNGPIAI